MRILRPFSEVEDFVAGRFVLPSGYGTIWYDTVLSDARRSCQKFSVRIVNEKT